MIALAKTKKLKEELDILRPFKAEDKKRIMDKFRLDWNYHSNHLEGNSLSYGETKALILFGITAQGKPLKDHFEITGHNDAVNWVLDVVKDERVITGNFIRELHKLILKEPYEVDAITPDGKPTKKKIKIGVYKETPNHVKTSTGEIFRFATPEETPAKMNDLLAWYEEKSTDEDVNPVLLAAEFHYQFIRIHPFDDGNGRLARILMNFILLRFGYPPVVVKTEDKASYLSTLQQADAGVFEPFFNYISENLNHSLELMIRGAKGEDIEEPGDIEKELLLLEQEIKNTGDPIDSKKSKGSLDALFDDSLKKLADTFFERSEVFEKHYLDSRASLALDGKGMDIKRYSVEKTISRFKPHLNKTSKDVEFKFLFDAFNRKGLGDFNFSSNISINFGNVRYKVSASFSKMEIEKYYNEQLTEAEIDQLVNSELKRHTAAIKEKLATLNNNQNEPGI